MRIGSRSDITPAGGVPQEPEMNEISNRTKAVSKLIFSPQLNTLSHAPKHSYEQMEGDNLKDPVRRFI